MENGSSGSVVAKAGGAELKVKLNELEQGEKEKRMEQLRLRSLESLAKSTKHKIVTYATPKAATKKEEKKKEKE